LQFDYAVRTSSSQVEKAVARRNRTVPSSSCRADGNTGVAAKHGTHSVIPVVCQLAYRQLSPQGLKTATPEAAILPVSRLTNVRLCCKAVAANDGKHYSDL